MKRFVPLTILSLIILIICFIYFLKNKSKEIDFIEGGDIRNSEIIDSINFKDSLKH